MEKTVENSITTMTELVMPNDANPLNNLMGGNLMRWMDIVGGICAANHCEAHVVTASVDHVSFHSPILVGEVVTLTAQVTRAFTTSVEVYVEVMANSVKGENRRRSNHAFMTFVALDDVSKRPKKVPGFKPQTEHEVSLYQSASRRREIRLVLSGRMKPEQALEIQDFFLKMRPEYIDQQS